LPAKIAPFEVLHATADKFYLYFMVRFFLVLLVVKGNVYLCRPKYNRSLRFRDRK